MIPGTPDSSGKALRETLHAQQDLLQQLYTELDVEREAAATATDESLSMMLRLQGEKAGVEMEASQYKRIAEEKMVHAEETLATFRDLIYQKEMQIASLEFQVQAYKFKLLSFGCNDVSECDTNYPENMLFKRNGLSSREARLRRGVSLPPNFCKDGEEAPESGCLEAVPETETRDLDLSHAKGDFSCYWEKIKRLDERVKELDVDEELPENENEIDNNNNKLNEISLQSQGSSSSFFDALRGEMTPRVDLMDVEPGRNPSKVQDIFEVPETPIKLGKEKLSPEAPELNHWKPEQIKHGISGFIDKNNWDKKVPMSPNVERIIHRPRDGLGVEQLYFKRHDVHDFELQQMNRRLKSLEDERITGRHEICVEKDDEQMFLLKSIKDQLNSIQDEIMSLRHKKALPEKQLDLASLSEVGINTSLITISLLQQYAESHHNKTMLHFW